MRSGICAISGLTAAVLGASLPAFAVEQAGISAAVRGDVRIQPQGGAERALKSGEDIAVGDRVRSGPDGSLQVLLLDETTFTIGPDSDMAINAFKPNGPAGAGQVEASVERGTFRFVTGQVANANPENMKVRTPRAILGVRGTIVSGAVSNTETMVTLGGPGSRNNGGERVGALLVSSASGNLDLRRQGFVAVVNTGGTEVRAMDAVMRERLFAPPPSARPTPRPAGSSGSSSSSSGGSSASADAGQSGAAGGDGATSASAAASTSGVAAATAASTTADTAREQRRNDLAVQAAADAVFNATQFNTSFAELRSVNAGTATFSQTNVPILATFAPQGFIAGAGQYDVTMQLNFPARTIEGKFFNIVVAGSAGGTANNNLNGGELLVAATTYNGLNGAAAMVFNSPCGGGGVALCTGQVAFVNLGNSVARRMNHILEVKTFDPVGDSTGNLRRHSTGAGTATGVRAP